MKKARKFVVFVVGLVVAGATAFRAEEAWACDFADPSVYGGPLIVVRGDDFDVELPRNAAFLLSPLPSNELGAPYLQGEDEDGNPVSVPVEQLAGSYPMGRSRSGHLYVLAGPVPPGTTALGLTIGDYVDDQAPTAPRVLNASIDFHDGGPGDSCGDYTYLDVGIEPATDEHVPELALVYGVYLASSESEAASAAVPELMIERSEFGEPQLGSLIGNQWSESDTYLSISAFDAAGNESPRTDPVRIKSSRSSSSDGCTWTAAKRGGSLQSATFALVACAAWMRRATKRRAQLRPTDRT